MLAVMVEYRQQAGINGVLFKEVIFVIEYTLLEECNNCSEFEVTQDTQHHITLGSGDIWKHTITCRHINKCKNLKAYLQKEVNTDGNRQENDRH